MCGFHQASPSSIRLDGTVKLVVIPAGGTQVVRYNETICHDSLIVWFDFWFIRHLE